MKEETSKYTAVDINGALLKIGLYIAKIVEGNGSHAMMEKLCHLTVESCLKLGDSE
jgi:hypothetical protein